MHGIHYIAEACCHWQTLLTLIITDQVYQTQNPGNNEAVNKYPYAMYYNLVDIKFE